MTAATIVRWNGLRIIGHETFRGTPREVSTARDWVRKLLADHVGGDALDTVELLVSELVTNAVVHSDSRNDVLQVCVAVGHGVAMGGDVVHVEVIDRGSTVNVPRMRNADDLDLGGRGLDLVHRLADAWSSEHSPTRGVVWFQVGCSPAS
ncbi:ATP-binding protein [Streptosporangium sp. NPDC006007]|uniref:ATP-binding protein n=1 Tax=Streptosporangium sp. NPDC006007 TaxID=3154575 RepID=UPI0033A18E78